MNSALYNLFPFNSYRISSLSRIFYTPKNVSELITISNDIGAKNYKIIGRGNNIIFSKPYYNCYEPILCLAYLNQNAYVDGAKIVVGAGYTINQLCQLALVHGLTGVENIWDIPSSVGGAVAMNAGAYGMEMADVIEWVKVLNLKNNKIVKYTNSEMLFDKRRSMVNSFNHYVVLQACISLTYSSRNTIGEKMSEIEAKRRNSFPYEFPNAGSVFVKKDGSIAISKIIDQIGLKGYRMGKASVSKKHAGFIINTDGASGHDILKLIDYLKKRILHECKIDLCLEQKIV